LLLVVGENDRSIPPADAKRIKQLLPGAKILRMPGLGHLAHEERPAEVAELLREFFR
jgi:magnesium chelatase accessory protein